MSIRDSRLALHGLWFCLVLGALAACGNDGAPKPTDPPASALAGAAQEDVVEDGAAEPAKADPPTPPDVEKQKAAHLKKLAEMNTYGRGLLESFDSRVYSPGRDAQLRGARAVVTVRIDGAEGLYHVTFDASLAEGERTAVTPDPKNGELPAGTEEQVSKFARLSFGGAYREVVHYLPPNDLLVTPSRDKLHRVVTAPPHKLNLQVSYSVDEKDMVMIRGTSVRPQAEIVRFDWATWRGRQLLSRMTFHGTDATVDYVYDDTDTGGVVLLERATVRKSGHAFDATFRYESIDVGAGDSSENASVDPDDER